MSACDVGLADPEDGAPRLEVTGEVDITCAPLLRERLLEVIAREPPGIDLVVDLTAVSFIDGTCLGVLAAASTRLSDAGGQMTVIASAAARRALRLAGLDAVWRVLDASGASDPH